MCVKDIGVLFIFLFQQKIQKEIGPLVYNIQLTMVPFFNQKIRSHRLEGTMVESWVTEMWQRRQRRNVTVVLGLSPTFNALWYFTMCVTPAIHASSLNDFFSDNSDGRQCHQGQHKQ